MPKWTSRVKTKFHPFIFSPYLTSSPLPSYLVCLSDAKVCVLVLSLQLCRLPHIHRHQGPAASLSPQCLHHRKHLPSPPQGRAASQPSQVPTAVALISELFVFRGSIEPDHLPSRTKPTARDKLLLAPLTSFLFSAVVALNPHRLRSLPLTLMFWTLSINFSLLAVSALPPLVSGSHFPLGDQMNSNIGRVDRLFVCAVFLRVG